MDICRAAIYYAHAYNYMAEAIWHADELNTTARCLVVHIQGVLPEVDTDMSSVTLVTCTQCAHSSVEATSCPHKASLESFRHTLDGWNGLLFNDYLNADGVAANSVIDAGRASLQAYKKDLAKEEAQREAEQGARQASVKSYVDKSVTTRLSRTGLATHDKSHGVVDFGHRILRWKPDHLPDQRPCCQCTPTFSQSSLVIQH